MTTLDITQYRQPVLFIGAGMSAESGVPTYRGAGGIWQQYDYRQYACQRAFDRDPEKVLRFHELRREVVMGCQPHAGHHHLALLQQAHPNLKVVTQNTDGMLQRAGINVAAELHGSLWRLRCRCGVREDRAAAAYEQHRCAICNSWLRPDITWFEDRVDIPCFEEVARIVGGADLFVSIGTSGVVHPAVKFIRQAQLVGAEMVEINPEETEVSMHFQHCIRRAAATAIAIAFPV